MILIKEWRCYSWWTFSEARLSILGWPISPILIVTPVKVAEVSVIMLNMKVWLIYMIHLTTAVKFIIAPDLHQTNIG